MRSDDIARATVEALMDIAFVIPTYNRADDLRQLLVTMVGLDVPAWVSWEVVLVDNNSSDETRTVAAEFAGALPLRYVFERRQGASHARRRGVLETSSQFIAFVDDDNLLFPSWLVEALDFLRGHPAAGAVGARVQLLWEIPPDDLLFEYRRCLAEQDLGDEARQMPATGFTYLAGEALVVRRRALELSGWIERGVLDCRRGGDLTSGGDSEMVLRIRNAGYELWYTPAMQQHHRIPRQRMTLAHLCGLHRGFGQSHTVLHGLADRRAATLYYRLREVARSCWYLARSSVRIGAQFLTRRPSVDPRERLSFYQALGYVEGALTVLWRGYAL
jgi:glycosyltransferase involved in cell wall biosynthesis